MTRPLKTINHILLEAMDDYAPRTCLHVKYAQRFEAVPYHHFRTLTLQLAHYFLQRGLETGARIALIGENTLEWLTVYVAGHLAGALVVPIRAAQPEDSLKFMLVDSDPFIAVVQGEEQCRLLATLEKKLPNLNTILLMDETDHLPDGVFPISSILTGSITPDQELTLRQHALNLPPSTLATIYYTNCADGRLCGAIFDLGQEFQALQSMKEWFKLDDDDLGFTSPQPLSDQPNLHAALHYFVSGVANVLAEGDETSFQDLQHTSPTVTVTTPYAFEFIYLQVMDQISQLPKSSQEVFQWALNVGKDYHAAGINASLERRERYERADMTFFSNIRGMMGGRLRRLISVGAPLPHHWVEFAEAIGLLPLDVYALTKAGGCPAASRPSAHQPGSCGRTTPGFQIRIAEDGEVLVRGDTIMRGYWNNPQETARTIDAEGWLHTGDLGCFDGDGYLTITGRKYLSLVLATGRKVTPATIESRLTSRSFVAQAMICGAGRRYLTALIVPDFHKIGAHLRKNRILDNEETPTVEHPALVNLLAEEVAAVNATLDGWEQIEQYTLLAEPFQLEEKGPVEVVEPYRPALVERYGALFEAMYPAATPFAQNEVTQVQLEPELLRQLLEKEGILDAWMNDAGIGFLLELARAKQIDAPSMVHICETVAAIAHMQNEAEPLSTAFIVGNPARIARVLPGSALQLRQYDHILRMRRTVTALAKIVDGQVLGYAVDKHGFVRDIHRLGIALEQAGSDLTGTHFRHHAAISRQCDAVIFSIPPGGRQVRVFADGQLVGRYVNGRWLRENADKIDTAVADLAQHKEFDVHLLRRLLRCAFKMSEKNLGAILLLGDADAILERSDRSEIQNVATVVSVALADLFDEELICFAKQDGATVIDTNGELRGFMVLLRPAAATRAQIEPGKGARHSSAAKISAETDSIAITISEDGPISVYDAGQRVLSL